MKSGDEPAIPSPRDGGGEPAVQQQFTPVRQQKPVIQISPGDRPITLKRASENLWIGGNFAEDRIATLHHWMGIRPHRRGSFRNPSVFPRSSRGRFPKREEA